MPSVRVFNYIEALDAFLVTDEFARIADFLGLTEWHPVVWIGRLFTMDNDLGEHWFDNWNGRDEKQAKAAAMGIDPFDLMILKDDPFQDGRDGPCHSPAFRRRFWTDVLKSLELSHDLLFEEARAFNESAKAVAPDEFIANLGERIAHVQASLPIPKMEPPPLE